MLQRPSWKTEAGPALVADVGAVRLLVKDVGGHVRFLVLRATQVTQPPSQVLIASGTATDVRGAMLAAEQVLDRIGTSATASLSAS